MYFLPKIVHIDIASTSFWLKKENEYLTLPSVQLSLSKNPSEILNSNNNYLPFNNDDSDFKLIKDTFIALLKTETEKIFPEAPQTELEKNISVVESQLDKGLFIYNENNTIFAIPNLPVAPTSDINLIMAKADWTPLSPNLVNRAIEDQKWLGVPFEENFLNDFKGIAHILSADSVQQFIQLYNDLQALHQAL